LSHRLANGYPKDLQAAVDFLRKPLGALRVLRPDRSLQQVVSIAFDPLARYEAVVVVKRPEWLWDQSRRGMNWQPPTKRAISAA
jgi:hypothetical protein